MSLTWQPLLYLALCRQLSPLASSIVAFAADTTKICQKLETTITEISQEGLNPKNSVRFKPKFFGVQLINDVISVARFRRVISLFQPYIVKPSDKSIRRTGDRNAYLFK
jgi:hypothetical protein